VLAPGLRMGFLVAPDTVYSKLLQAKQASDLHSPGFNQRLIAEVMQGDFLGQHIPKIRNLYRSQRDAMLAALQAQMPEGVRWNTPEGGMFLWVKLPTVKGKPMNAVDLLPVAVAHGVAFVPGAPFYTVSPDISTLRLSFVTASADEITKGVGLLAAAIAQHAATL
jgi:2-aminoadipate transaminase